MKKKQLFIIFSFFLAIIIGIGTVWFATQHQPSKAESLTFTGTVKNTNDWAGAWYRMHGDGAAEIIITKVAAESFDFDLSAQWLDQFKQIRGVAKYSGNRASYQERDNGKIELSLNDGELTVDTKNVITGMNVYFDGVYSKIPPEKITLAQLKVLPDRNTDYAFREFIGIDYNLFRDSLGWFGKRKNLDDFKAAVVAGQASHKAGYTAAIIMIGSDGRFWAAYKPENNQYPDLLPGLNTDDTIYYFTNDVNWNTRLPKTIEDWRNTWELYKRVVYVDKPPIKKGVDYPVLIGYLSEGNRHVIYDKSRVLIKTSAGIKSLTHNTQSAASRPAVDPLNRRCAYVYPVEWEVIGDVYVYDPHLDTSEIILSQKDIPQQSSPKAVCWLDEWRIAVIIGPAYGSISDGGDIYTFDTRSRKLTLDVKADEGKQFKDIFHSGDAIVAEQVSYKEGTYSEDRPKYVVYDCNDLLGADEK